MPTSAETHIARTFPSYRDFVDDALFDPTWGYYATGQVRFGDGGHYDTYPLALSPLFGRMVAHAAFRFWQRAGRPHALDLCEVGAGNGQLCLDVLAAVSSEQSGAWRRFRAAFGYRIVERSPALIARQRAQLGPMAAHVEWTRADLSTRAARGAPLGRVGFVFANEVLDCLAHHKVVRSADGVPRVVFVVPRVGRTLVPRTGLGRVLADPRRRRRLRFDERALPLATVPGLATFLARHHPSILGLGRPRPPYFACPAIVPLVTNVGGLYQTSETWWIDYGCDRRFHERAPERKRVFAGPPRSNRSVYDAPGEDDITFMVDFSVVANAARDAGLEVACYGGQGLLAKASGIRLDAAAVDLIVRYKTLGWMLNAMGVGPERAWRQGGLTFSGREAKGGRLEAGVKRDVATFLGRRPSHFKAMVLTRVVSPRRRG